MDLRSSVCVATSYGMDGQGSNCGGEKVFLFYTTSGPALGLTQLPLQWVPGSISRRAKGPGREADHSPPSSAQAKNGGAAQGQLYLACAYTI